MSTANEKSGNYTFWKALIHFKIIPKDDPKQALRIRRFFMAATLYLFCSSLAYVSYLANILEWQAIAVFLIIIPVINISLYIVFRTGLNLKMADQSLTAIQMCAAILVTMYGMYFANEARGVLLLIYVIILLFGIFQLNTRGFLYVSAFTLLTYGCDIALLHLFRPQGVNFHIEYLQGLVFALVLAAFSFIGGYISSLRHNLTISRSELENSISVIREMSIRDELTGIFNRRHLLERLEDEKNRASRGGTLFSVIMLDIDHFKKVNDTYGHLRGDQVLRAVAKNINSILRKTDYCGRYGGEEFLVVLTQTDAEGAKLCAERIRKRIERQEIPELGPDFKLTASLGLTEYRIREVLEDVIGRADEALYRAKKRGRNRVEYS